MFGQKFLPKPIDLKTKTCILITMFTFNKFQSDFLEQAKPIILKELEAFKHFDTIQFSDINDEDLLNFRKNMLINSFIELTGTIFFLSHGIFEDDLMRSYIEFCNQYGRLLV